MKIDIRYIGAYINVAVITNDTQVDLGLHDKDRATLLKDELESALREISDYIGEEIENS